MNVEFPDRLWELAASVLILAMLSEWLKTHPNDSKTNEALNIEKHRAFQLLAP